MKLLLSALLLLLAHSVRAEMRKWTSVNGDTISAEFHLRTMDSVRLKTDAGKIITVPFTGLSTDDQAYVELLTPPALSIDVDPNRNSVNESVLPFGGEGYLILDFKVEVRKKSRMSYSRPLRLDLYVVGEQERSGYFIILQQYSTRMVFSEKSSLKTVRPGQLVLKYSPDEAVAESDYAGYLLVITDERDDKLVIKSNKKFFEKHAARFNGLKTGATLYPGTLEEAKYQ